MFAWIVKAELKIMENSKELSARRAMMVSTGTRVPNFVLTAQQKHIVLVAAKMLVCLAKAELKEMESLKELSARRAMMVSTGTRKTNFALTVQQIHIVLVATKMFV